jgi:hypothetical protein
LCGCLRQPTIRPLLVLLPTNHYFRLSLSSPLLVLLVLVLLPLLQLQLTLPHSHQEAICL